MENSKASRLKRTWQKLEILLLGSNRRRRIHTDDRAFLLSWMQQLRADYEGFPHPEPLSPADVAIKKILEKEPDAIDWEDAYSLELLMIRVVPVDYLRARTPVLQKEYEELTEKKLYAEELLPEEGPGAAPDLMPLRARLATMQTEINWIYTASWSFEDFRSSVTRRLLQSTRLLLEVFFLSYLVLLEANSLFSGSFGVSLNATPLIIAMTGAIGGFISALRRVQGIRLTQNTDLSLIDLEQNNSAVFLAPIYGSVFATILYFVFVAKLLGGEFFPNIPDGDVIYGVAEPADGVNQAKLIVWSFIAGFAEKFVPDKLDQLTKE